MIPTPPTYADIWNAVFSEAFTDAAKSSGAYVAPAAPGLTGLPTKIWAQFPNGQSISRDVTINGYRIQATAVISEVHIAIVTPKGSRTTLVTLHPNDSSQISAGSFEHPNAQYVFRYSGTHVISTDIAWTADTATLSGPDIGTLSVPIGSVRLEINRDYPVEQMRPGLTR